ncbi:MAG: hypothetical protein FJY77_04845 [Candidatus Altiarchaeales archaeon]|nr:hypothetical protein [Candidatus Altiarchaeales archaeon]
MDWKTCMHAVIFFCMLAITQAAAQEASVMQFSVLNTPPTVGTVSCTQAGDKVLCSAIVTDLNGYNDILGCNGTLQKAGMEDKYYNNSCSLSDGSGITVNCACFFAIQPLEGQWTANLTAKDPVAYGQAEGKVTILKTTGDAGLSQLTGMIVQANIPKAESKPTSTTTTTTTTSTSTTLAGNPQDNSLKQITGEIVQPPPNTLLARLQEILSWFGF